MGKRTEDPSTDQSVAEAGVTTKAQKRLVGQRINSFNIDAEATRNAQRTYELLRPPPLQCIVRNLALTSANEPKDARNTHADRFKPRPAQRKRHEPQCRNSPLSPEEIDKQTNDHPERKQ